MESGPEERIWRNEEKKERRREKEWRNGGIEIVALGSRPDRIKLTHPPHGHKGGKEEKGLCGEANPPRTGHGWRILPDEVDMMLPSNSSIVLHIVVWSGIDEYSYSTEVHIIHYTLYIIHHRHN